MAQYAGIKPANHAVQIIDIENAGTCRYQQADGQLYRCYRFDQLQIDDVTKQLQVNIQCRPGGERDKCWGQVNVNVAQVCKCIDEVRARVSLVKITEDVIVNSLYR